MAANADLGSPGPAGRRGLELRGYAFKFGIEGYGKLNVGITGVGELNYCKGQTTVKLCGSGSVTGGIKGGLLKWPFEVVKLEAYVYGQISGHVGPVSATPSPAASRYWRADVRLAPKPVTKSKLSSFTIGSPTVGSRSSPRGVLGRECVTVQRLDSTK
ncbi:MAG: hypothetical protein R2856_07395 [Caldilineaceae bacterium]